MNPHLRRLLALLAAVAMLAVACGGDDDGDEGAGGGGQLSGETVEVIAKWTGGELDAAKQVMAAFTEETGIKVNLQGVGDDLPTILSTRVEGGNPPDIAQLPQPGLLVDLAKRGALIPIDDVVGDAVDERYEPVWRDLGSHEGKLYGVWFKAANKSTVWYRTEAWKDAELEPPETWEEWKTASQDLLDAGVKPLTVGGADGWVLTDWFENVYLRTAGPEKYDQLAAHEIPWTDPSVKQALTKLREILGEEDFLAKGLSGSLQVTFEDSVKQVFGSSPEAATVFEGDFVANVIRDETEAKAGTDFDFFPWPSIDGSDPAVMGGGDVVVMLKDKPAARELLEYLATAEAAEIWAELGGFSSPNKDVDLDVYPDDISRRAAEQLVEAKTFRFDLSDLVPAAFGGTKGAGMWGRLQDWLADPADIDGITQKLEAEANAAGGG
ncbi:MAG TPA: ABC transporter substrate-binding protein [Acidimicrobiales bacterium]|nr:ABC transporter substrate-binding protein [Acidimicrobiales bacterium]